MPEINLCVFLVNMVYLEKQEGLVFQTRCSDFPNQTRCFDLPNQSVRFWQTEHMFLLL
jgi:hypothetical protein